jgi:hypothetical protein
MTWAVGPEEIQPCAFDGVPNVLHNFLDIRSALTESLRRTLSLEAFVLGYRRAQPDDAATVLGFRSANAGDGIPHVAKPIILGEPHMFAPMVLPVRITSYVLPALFVFFVAYPASIHQMGETMAKYLISFPSAAMIVPDGEWEAIVGDSHAVIEEAKAAGVYVFGGGIDEIVPPVLVSADGAVAEGGYPWAPPLNGGFTVLELPSRDDAVAWAARIAKACRCPQELRVFGYDPAS